ncbi:MAG: sulfatase-like hydrolase/transferase [Planctomycetaceae bacterium]
MPATDSDKRPNILWYCTDQQRFDTISALGCVGGVTPHLDDWLQSGTAFTHAYCQSPICTPSRSSFMTGMYPSRIHNCRNGNDRFADHPRLISQRIAEAGYDTGMVGKFHLQSSGLRTEPRLDDGYRFWRFSHAPRDDWSTGHDYADWVRARGGDLDALRQHPERVPAELHQTTWTSDCAIEFLSQPRDQPWFLTLNPYDPHPPFIPPRSYADRFSEADMPGPHFRNSDLEQQRRLKDVAFQTLGTHPDAFDGRRVQADYYAMIAQIDDQFARLLQFLDDSGQREQTVVVFTSDHGEMLGDHGLLYKGCRFYEGLVRVPLIFAWPGSIQSDVRSSALVELIDLSATLLELAGVALPESMQGRSLLPILLGQAAPDTHRDFVRCEYFDALAPDFISGGLSYATMYRNRCHKLCMYHSHGLGELYDLDLDPWEHNNLWDSERHRATRDELVRASFDATMMHSIDLGSERIAPM